MDEPFLEPDSPRLADVFTDGVVHILAVRGVDQFSVRGIARWMRVAPSTILNEYSRARVIELVAICFAQRWLAWSTSGDWWSDPSAAPLTLPRTEAERHGVRVLEALHVLALAERQRGNPLPLGHLERLERDEFAVVVERTRRSSGLEAPRLNTYACLVHAALRGLRTRLAVPDASLTHDEATAALKLLLATGTPAGGAQEEVAS